MDIFLYEHVSANAPPFREITSGKGSSLLAEGAALRDALRLDLRAMPGVGVLEVERDERAEFEALARRADFSLLVAPEFEGILESRARWVLEAGGRLLGSAPDVLGLCADKLLLGRHWSSHGVPTPRPVDAQEANLSFPLVWKPRDGAGSQATYLVCNRDELRQCPTWAVEEGWIGEGMVQEFVAGLPASVAFLVGPGRRYPLLPARQRLSTDGRFHYLGSEIPLPEPLAERAVRLGERALAAVPGLRGYIGVDLVLGETDVAIEINPRLTTSYLRLRQLFAGNLVQAWIDVVRGKDIELRWNT